MTEASASVCQLLATTLVVSELENIKIRGWYDCVVPVFLENTDEGLVIVNLGLIFVWKQLSLEDLDW